MSRASSFCASALVLATLLVGSALGAQTHGGPGALAGGLTTRPGAVRLWVVDSAGGPGADFTEIQTAVWSAGEGDVVLVRSGFYSSFSLSAKSLAIVGVGGFRPGINYTTEIADLALHQRVVLRNLQLGPTSVALQLRNCAGAISVVDCRIEGDDTFGASGTKDALRILSCENVTLERCLVRSPDEPYGENGALVVQSNLLARDTWFLGGLPDFPSTQGGAGLALSSSTLLAYGSHFVGGTGGFGGDWGDPTCFAGGVGGSGLSLNASSAFLSSCTATGGPGGSALGTPCSDGPPGLPIEADPSSTVTLLRLGSR